MTGQATLADPGACSECGRKNPADSRYCFCGNDLVIPPAPLPEPGVRGWLLWFCLQLLVLNPVLISYQAFVESRALHASAPTSHPIAAMAGVDLVVRIATMMVGLIAATLLIRRHAISVQFVRAYLVWFALNYFALVALPYAFALDSGARTRVAAMYLYRAVMTVPATSFWFLYFKHSKRVKVTYPDA